MKYPNRNASPTNFGFQFQINVAIFFMFKYLKELKNIKIEGESEDVELTLKNSSKYMIQAKSNGTNLENNTNNSTKLREALESLAEADKKNGKVTGLYYVSNLKNPLNSRINEFERDYVTIHSYNELDATSQNKIDKQIKNNLENHDNNPIYDIDKNKLWIMKIPFFGEDQEQRHTIIYERAKEELSKMSDSLANRHRFIVNQLEAEFLQNAASGITTIISDKRICNLLIIDELKSTEIGDKYEKIGISESEFFEAKSQYEKYLDKKINNYENYLKVNYLFEKRKQRNHITPSEFVKEEKISLYNYFFSKEVKSEDELNEIDLLDVCVAQIISYMILIKQTIINKVRKEAGLC